MNLARDLDEPDRRVEVLADLVLLEGFNLGYGHTRLLKVSQGVLEQSTAEPLATGSSAYDQIMDPADARLDVALHGDVADNFTVLFIKGDSQLGSRQVDVAVDVACLPPPPSLAGDWSQPLIDVVIDGNAFKAGDGQVADDGSVILSKWSNHDFHGSLSVMASLKKHHSLSGSRWQLAHGTAVDTGSKRGLSHARSGRARPFQVDCGRRDRRIG
jgi:hypothetical protein